MRSLLEKLISREALIGGALVAILVLNWERGYGLSEEVVGQVISALIIGAGWLMTQKKGSE